MIPVSSMPLAYVSLRNLAISCRISASVLSVSSKPGVSIRVMVLPATCRLENEISCVPVQEVN